MLSLHFGSMLSAYLRPRERENFIGVMYEYVHILAVPVALGRSRGSVHRILASQRQSTSSPKIQGWQTFTDLTIINFLAKSTFSSLMFKLKFFSRFSILLIEMENKIVSLNFSLLVHSA